MGISSGTDVEVCFAELIRNMMLVNKAFFPDSLIKNHRVSHASHFIEVMAVSQLYRIKCINTDVKQRYEKRKSVGFWFTTRRVVASIFLGTKANILILLKFPFFF